MSPKDNIFPSKKDILEMIQFIPVENIEEEDDSEMEDDSVNNLELLSDIASLYSPTQEMEDIEMMTDNDDDKDDDPELYHQLLCLEEMEPVDSETPPSSGNHDGYYVLNPITGDYSVRRRLFSDMSSSSSSSSSSFSSYSSSDESE